MTRAVIVPRAGELSLSLSSIVRHDVVVSVRELWGEPVAATLTCRAGPVAMIAAAAPAQARLAAIPITRSSTATLSVGGDDLAVWCAADPSVVGTAALTGGDALITVVVPRPRRPLRHRVGLRRGLRWLLNR